MKLVIDIPEGLKIDFESEQWTALSCMEMKDALMNGTPLTERPKGKWINRYYMANKVLFKRCSECDYEYSYDAETGISDANYCPNCGAEMSGGGEK